MSKMRSYDGMRESDALLAIDGEGKWVLRTEAMERIAALEEEVRAARRDVLLEAIDEIQAGKHETGDRVPMWVQQRLERMAKEDV